MLEGHVLQDDDGVLGRVLLQQRLEVGRAGRQHHLVRLARLAVAGQGHVREGLLVPQVLEGADHVGLEVVPAEAELLLVASHLGGGEVSLGLGGTSGGESCKDKGRGRENRKISQQSQIIGLILHITIGISFHFL